MITTRLAGAICLGLALAGAAFAAPTTLVLERGVNGFDGFQDTSIFRDSADGAVNSAGGGIDGVFSGLTAQLGVRRALVRVDLSSIPNGARVTQVTLELTVDRSGGNFGNVDQSMHRALKSWGEGVAVASGAGGDGGSAGTGDATWLANHFGVSVWTTPGGDFDAAASAVASAGRSGAVAKFTGAGLVADVQAWVDDPGSNFGWFILGDEVTAQRVKRFFSSEAASKRPRLTVVYDTGASANDINGDGTVDAVDIQLVINAALGLDVGGVNTDVNADHTTDAVDIQTVINSVLGLV